MARVRLVFPLRMLARWPSMHPLAALALLVHMRLQTLQQLLVGVGGDLFDPSLPGSSTVCSLCVSTSISAANIAATRAGQLTQGATVEQIAAATGWQHHTIRGAISGALKKKLGLTIGGHPHARGRPQQDRRQG